MASCGQPLQTGQPTRTLPTRTLPRTPTLATQSPPQLTATPTNIPGDVASAVPTDSSETTTPTSQAPTLPSGGTVVASGTAIVIAPRTPSAQDNQDRWRAQQIDRQVLETAQIYVAKQPAQLLWYDPLTGQVLSIGTLLGDFVVQARFVTRSTNEPALEVPYVINRDYGLTSISDAVRERMRAAGYTESVEAYVIESEGIVPK